MRVETGDVASLEPGRYCSPRHRTPLDSINEGVRYMSMTWRALHA
jgi:hypothetical protein